MDEQFLSQIVLPMIAIGCGISIAIALVENVGNSILKAFRDDDIKFRVSDERVKAHLESVEKAKRRLETEEPEKPKRDFVEHDGDHLEVVEFEKPKRGDFQ